MPRTEGATDRDTPKNPSKLGAQAVEGMLALLRKGYSWDFIAKRYQISDAQARRLVREHMRGKEGK